MTENSSDSDSFEDFLLSLRKSKAQCKYRLSTGSVSSFITDGSHSNSFWSDDDSNKENIPCKTEVSLKESHVSDEELNKVSYLDKLTGKKSSSPKQCKSVGKSITNTSYKKLPVRSVATPMKKLFFSSDSDDDVFQAIISKQKVKKSIMSSKVSLTYSDSDIRHSFDIYSKIPSCDLSSESESDNSKIQTKPLSGVVESANTKKEFFHTDQGSLCNNDSDSDEIFLSLKARLMQPSHVSTYSTPLGLSSSNAKLFTKECFYSEKPIRKMKQTCLVKDCFLSTLDSGLTKTSQLHFRRNRVDLTKKLFKLFNESVFESKLPQELEISWAKRMTKTAGTTVCRRVCKSSFAYPSEKSPKVYEASIALSEKVIDSAPRLRDTLIHEMCHAAVWLLDNASESHGPFWKSWAAKARRIHPELPPIERCHNYDINYKYIYQCKRCETTYGRHSKSIDIEKKVCGRCAGKLELNQSSKVKGANPFASYVKLNYNVTKSHIAKSTGQVSHRDIMKSLSEQFKTASIS